MPRMISQICVSSQPLRRKRATDARTKIPALRTPAEPWTRKRLLRLAARELRMYILDFADNDKDRYRMPKNRNFARWRCKRFKRVDSVKYGTIMVTVVGTKIDQSSVLIATICPVSAKPSSGGVVWDFFKRTINVTEYRNGKDKVNPAKHRTGGGATNHSIPSH